MFVIYVKFLSCCKFLTLFHDLKHKSNLRHPLRKTVRIRSYSGPHFSRIFPHSDWIRRDTSYSKLFWSVFFPQFPAFGLNTESYFVSLRIQSECGKMWEKCRPELLRIRILFTQWSVCRNIHCVHSVQRVSRSFIMLKQHE